MNWLKFCKECGIIINYIQPKRNIFCNQYCTLKYHKNKDYKPRGKNNRDRNPEYNKLRNYEEYLEKTTIELINFFIFPYEYYIDDLKDAILNIKFLPEFKFIPFYKMNKIYIKRIYYLEERINHIKKYLETNPRNINPIEDIVKSIQLYKDWKHNPI